MFIATYLPPVQSGTPAQVELPLYGSGKLGMAFKYPDHYKYNYEITDHLGNVRAIATRLKFMATATAEDNYQTWEALNFENMDMRHADAAFNHTPGGQKVIWLNGAQGRHIGPARALRVLPNDTIKMEAFANYLAPAANQNLVSNFAALVAGGFGYANTGETAQAFSAITSALTGAALVPNHSGSVPKAYLKYLIFNKDFQLVHHGEQKITSGAAVQYNAGGQVTSIPHQRLYREVVVTEAMVGSEDYGYMYIYLANESNNNVNVYFDDFTITHLGVDILQTTDYYPFGLVSKHWQKAEWHRFGYQGQYAEKDEETGWNHFELRDYDPVVGRWMAVDPKRAGFSPYWGMDNNPTNLVDPDGGCPACPDPADAPDWFTQGVTYSPEGSDATYLLRDPSLGQDGWVRVSDPMLNEMVVTPSTFDNVLFFGETAARDFVNNLAYVGQGIGKPIWHNFDREILGGEGFESGVLPYTFDRAWNWRQKDRLDHRETVHRTVGVVVTVISAGLPGSAVIGSSSTATNVVGGFAVKQTAGTVFKKSVDYSIGYHE